MTTDILSCHSPLPLWFKVPVLITLLAVMVFLLVMMWQIGRGLNA